MKKLFQFWHSKYLQRPKMTFITPGQLTQRRSEVFINRKNKLSSVQLVGIKARITKRRIFVSHKN